MAAAILVPLGLIIIVRVVWPKANPGAKYAAIGGVLFALWALLAVDSLAAAMVVAGGVASGIVGFIHGLAELLVHL
jgi:hypothetical protein